MMTDPKAGALYAVLETLSPTAVAVSGGVDSLTLAMAAHRVLAGGARMFHAVSAAVPAEATQRVRELAARHGWTLRVIDAGEFNQPDYMANPVNRCFHCKTSLYGRIRSATEHTIVSGTNTDDLGEYRPGLDAATRLGVRHPFVEANLSKGEVRLLARHLGLGDVAELPAAPCLSSRIETGIRIDAKVLALVHRAERLVDAVLRPKTVRCRVRAAGVAIELDTPTLDGLDAARRHQLERDVAALFADTPHAGHVRFAPYRIGSAFLHQHEPH